MMVSTTRLLARTFCSVPRLNQSGHNSLRVRSFATGSSSSGELRKTPLYDFHIEHGAKMVPFAGYAMPLTYGSVGAVASHHHVRKSVGLFDVGHMVQTNFRGPTVSSFLSYLTPSSLSSLPPYTSTLSVLLNPQGGIIDDTVITKHSDSAFYVVTNAGRRERDLAWFEEKVKEWNVGEEARRLGGVEMEVLDGWGLVALQGPEAAKYLQSLTSFDLSQLTFGKAAFMSIGGIDVHVARGGYTGEDGFEISIPHSHTLPLTELLTQPPVQLTGLAARDSLRLEAGMCLYGEDIDEGTTPVEAGLSWVIGKERREKLKNVGKLEGGEEFLGWEEVGRQLREGPERRRVGFVVEGAPARHGYTIYAPGAEKIGTITSGIPSPTLSKNIAMGYVRSGFHKKGTEVEVEVRGKRRKAVVTGMPFVETRYYRG
ncbi:glycine cleavage system T protein [Panus rudis PR-1116 ss-1]|nr:glycine cleavage system T protein [Panus rudis PR-1116 ss-1]